MKCLLDSDILVYEVGFGSQHKDEITGELIINPFEQVADLLDSKIKMIEALTWATEPSTLYLTGDKKLNKSINKQRTRVGAEPIKFKENFRKEVAKTSVYKGQRSSQKPFHYYNIRQYIIANHDTVVSNGLEADDMLSIDLYRSHKDGTLDVMCCSRDKDLRMVPGIHFGWECGRQPQFGPHRVTELGHVSLSPNHKKVLGEGLAFFYSQMLTGDVVDNIKGCGKSGPVLAVKTLAECEQTELGFFRATKARYQEVYRDDWEDRFMENANLLWMVRELNEDGTPVLFQKPE